jgi:hypothetical protein
VAVPASVVTHKTPRNHRTTDASPRFYYHVRNTLWMLTRSAAFTGREKVRLSLGFIQTLPPYLRASGFSIAALGVVGRGLRDGFFGKPQR